MLKPKAVPLALLIPERTSFAALGSWPPPCARAYKRPMKCAGSRRKSRYSPRFILIVRHRSLAHNGLVGGSSPSSPTTQSYANRRFPVSDK
jgi:hypothetical protein